MKKIAYVFDDINYQSGAQKATFYQMQCLSEFYDIYAVSLNRPSDSLIIPGKVLNLDVLWNESEIYIKRFKNIITGKYSFEKIIRRIGYAISLRLGLGARFLEFFLYEGISDDLEAFDVVIVVSEASKLRSLVGELIKPKKIQWIHTDYKHWSQYSKWTKAVTNNDSRIYRHFDHIIVLSNACQAGLISILPELDDKVVVIPNMVNYTDIQDKSIEKVDFKVSDKKYNLVTVGRLDREKNFDRILGVCKFLADANVDYSWYFIGNGPMKHYIEKQINKFKLNENVILLGRLENPYPVMKQCDIYVLLSDYEGTPITIDEAAVLGLHIIATQVGGIPEQLNRYGKGILLNNENDLYEEFYKAINCLDNKNSVSMRQNNIMILKHVREIIEA